MKLRSSLGCIVGKPSVGKFMACSTVTFFEQAQVDGRPEECHPCRKKIAFLKAPLIHSHVHILELTGRVVVYQDSVSYDKIRCSSAGKIDLSLDALVD